MSFIQRSAHIVPSTKEYDELLAACQPVAWWKLDDPVGSPTIADSSGNGFTCTEEGPPITFGLPGPIAGGGTAASFPVGGGGQFAGAVTFTSSFTVTWWEQASTMPDNYTVAWAGESNAWGVYYQGPNGLYAQYTTIDTNTLRRTGSYVAGLPLDGEWHQLTFVFNMDSPGQSAALVSTDLFLDGEFSSSQLTSYTTVLSGSYVPTPVVVGYSIAGATPAAAQAQLALFNYPLAPNTIAALYKAARL